MKKQLFVLAILFAAAGLSGGSARAQQVVKQDVEGVDHFRRLESTIACAGVTKPEAVPGIKKMGFASIINLREASEEGANVEGEAAAAKEAGIRYVHIPFNGTNPDPAAADKFLAAITDPANDPAFIHCHGGNRAATMWLIKRLAVDHWDTDKAVKEATELGLTSDKLKQFAIDYAASHKK